MDFYAELAQRIIKGQEMIIGPVALEQARKVPGLYIDADVREIKFDGNEKETVNKLVQQYEGLFGRASIEVCKEAVHDIISKEPKDKLPQMLLQ